MSSVQSFGPYSLAAVRGSGADVRSAIADAAQATGTDFQYLFAQAKLESSLDPTARARTSSATGLYQFTGDTWLRTLDRHGADHGLGWASDAIQGGAVRDPAMRAQLLALRGDPQLSALMAGELANDNAAALSATLGRAPDASELYLAHFLGADGAGRFLGALSADPSQSAAAILPAAAAANRSTFYDASGAPRSVGDVMALIRSRLSAAMDTAPAADALAGVAPSAPVLTGGPLAREFQSAAARSGNAVPPPAASMADTLRDAFALNGGASVPAHVRAAYGRLSVLGL